MIESDVCASLLQELAALAGCVDREAVAVGLDVNFDAGKTEAFAAIVGPGAAAARQALAPRSLAAGAPALAAAAAAAAAPAARTRHGGRSSAAG